MRPGSILQLSSHIFRSVLDDDEDEEDDAEDVDWRVGI